MDDGELVIEQGGEEDLDSFFRDKDRRKQERMALKKTKARTEREQIPPTNAWMMPEEQAAAAEAAQLDHQFEPSATTDQQVQQTAEEGVSEEVLAARLQQQAAIYRPEDNDWIDPERDFGPVPGATGKKKKHHHHAPVGANAEDDKLLLLVAPSASKMQDLSEISTDKAAKSKAGSQTTGSTARGWSKVGVVEAEPIPVEVADKKPAEKEKEPEKEPEQKPVEQAPVPEEPQVYVPRHKRTEAAPAGSPRTASPVSKPAEAAAAPAPAGSAYVPPALRRQQQPQQSATSSPQLGGSSRPAGSGLAAAAQNPRIQAAQVKNKVMPDLKSADEFPSLG